MTPWHEDDELWAELEPALVQEAVWKAGAEEARQAAALLRVGQGARLLDLGCGPGRHSIELARLGYDVTGVDRTAAYLEHARAKSAAAAVKVEWLRASMLAFRRENAFDGAISLFSSFGYFEKAEDDLRVLANIFASLRPGGRAVVDLAGKEILARVFMPRYWQDLGNGRFWLQDREMAPGWERMRNHWIFVGAGEQREFSFEHRIYSAAELAGLMRQAGFEEVQVYGGLDGRPYDRDAVRLVAVCRRPERP